MKKVINVLLFVAVALSALAQTGGKATTDAKTCPLVRIEVERLPSLNIPRSGHSLFCLDGEIMAVGGHTSGFVPTATAEYFDKGAWHLLNTVYEHDQGLSIRLSSGKVMFAGGHEQHLGIGQIYAVELYDPKSRTFEGYGCLDKKRAMASAVELDSGHVIISGNWYHEDGMELFNGNERLFAFAKDVRVARKLPYIFRIANDDAIVFNSFDNYDHPIDTLWIDRLKGEPFRNALMDKWRPMRLDFEHHSEDCFIGDEKKGQYAYLFPVEDKDGNLGIMRVRGGKSRSPFTAPHSSKSRGPEDSNGVPVTFELLPTAFPIPTTGPWGTIHYHTSIIADRNNGRAYLIGKDEDKRLYVLSIEYAREEEGKNVPMTLYYTDEAVCKGFYPPVLDGDGNLVMVGGLTDSNFAPTADVILLRVGKQSATTSWRWWLFALIALLAVAVGVILFYYMRRRHYHRGDESGGKSSSPLPTPHSSNIIPTPSNPTPDDQQLAERICRLMEEERMYLNRDLRVTDVAERLGTHRNIVSNCINSQKGCSFNQFVNGYRLEHAKRLMLEQPDKKNALLAEESGFANETTFYRAFKTAFGLSPREWITTEMQNTEKANE